MRISDWSSDVCSSDLGAWVKHCFPGQSKRAHVARIDLTEPQIDRIAGRDVAACRRCGAQSVGLFGRLRSAVDVEREWATAAFGLKSEEHKSELQSLMSN